MPLQRQTGASNAEQLPRHLPRGKAVDVNDQVCNLLVVGLPFLGELRQDLERPTPGPPQQRPPVAPADPPGESGWLGTQPYDGAEGAKGGTVRPAQYGSASHAGNQRPYDAAEFADRLALGGSERILAFVGEHLRDRPASPPLHHLVGVDRRAAERLGEQPCDGRLAGTHHADEHYTLRAAVGRSHRRRHPRSLPYCAFPW